MFRLFVPCQLGPSRHRKGASILKGIGHSCKVQIIDLLQLFSLVAPDDPRLCLAAVVTPIVSRAVFLSSRKQARLHRRYNLNRRTPARASRACAARRRD